MFFGEVPCAQATDCILAHSLRAGDLHIRKGEVLTTEMTRELLAAGVERVTVARLGLDDIHEDNAASRFAEALCGQGVYLGKARTGRVNVYAADTGLLEVNRQMVFASNSISQAITFATLGENNWVPQGKLVATAKIIPFAVAEQDLDAAIKAGAAAGSALQLHKPTPHRAHLIQTTLKGTSTRGLEKTIQVCSDRLAKRQAELISSATCTHSISDLAITLEKLAASARYQSHDWVLIVGASAISDQNDVIPAAIRQLGGVIERLGIPVDPGNLLMNGELQGHRVIGLPGCARSPKPNGFDQFLDRMSCNLPLDDNWINSLAVGGLLNEIPERPHQRSKLATSLSQHGVRNTKSNSRVAAVILAAGRSQRFGEDNKLLAKWQGKPILQHTLANVAASNIDELILITGHESESLLSTIPALQQLTPAKNLKNMAHETGSASHKGSIGEYSKPLTLVHNPDYNEGMASSLRSAISFLADRNHKASPDTQATAVEAVLVCLGDMPRISAATINKLIDALRDNSKASAFIPVFKGKQGNPVILTSGLFDSLLSLSGDSGARKLLQTSPAVVTSVNVDDAAVLLDVDTTEELEALEQKT